MKSSSTSWQLLSLAVVTPLLLTACIGPECDPEDFDEDGYFSCPRGNAQRDCDDSDATVNPEADEVCDDEIDNNCDGVAAETTKPEVCANGIDDNCSGEIDELATNPGPEHNCHDDLDGNCNGVADEDEPECAPGDVVVSYSWDPREEVSSCAEASVTDLRLYGSAPRGVGAPQWEQLCDDTSIHLTDLPPGGWGFQVSDDLTNPDQFWQAETVYTTIVSGQTTFVEVLVECWTGDCQVVR